MRSIFPDSEMQARLSERFPALPNSLSDSDGLREAFDNAGWLFAAAAVPEVVDRGVIGKKNGVDRGILPLILPAPWIS